jgi:hypothetical protein
MGYGNVLKASSKPTCWRVINCAHLYTKVMQPSVLNVLDRNSKN